MLDACEDETDPLIELLFIWLEDASDELLLLTSDEEFPLFVDIDNVLIYFIDAIEILFADEVSEEEARDELLISELFEELSDELELISEDEELSSLELLSTDEYELLIEDVFLLEGVVFGALL